MRLHCDVLLLVAVCCGSIATTETVRACALHEGLADVSTSELEPARVRFWMRSELASSETPASRATEGRVSGAPG